MLTNKHIPWATSECYSHWVKVKLENGIQSHTSEGFILYKVARWWGLKCTNTCKLRWRERSKLLLRHPKVQACFIQPRTIEPGVDSWESGGMTSEAGWKLSCVPVKPRLKARYVTWVSKVRIKFNV